MRVASVTNHARRCATACAAKRSSPVSRYAEVSVATWVLRRTIARRCSTKLSGFVWPSRWMYGPSGLAGSGHQ